ALIGFTELKLAVQTVAARVHVTTPLAAQLKTFGYPATPEIDFHDEIADLKLVVGSITSRSDQVFDFTNAPGYYYFVAGYKSPTRYYHVSTAIRADTQRDLLHELRKAHPAVAVFDGPVGLTNWDGIWNTARHYDVSHYLLAHYRPFAAVDRFILMAR